MIILAVPLVLGLAALLAQGKTTRETILESIRFLIPSDWESHKFDWMMGPKLGPGRYKYYEKGHGTTCAIVVNAVLERAAIRPSALNRGKFYRGNDHLSALVKHAKSKGAYVASPKAFQPGDIYYIQENGRPENWHAGFFFSGGNSAIVTADGGQSNAAGNQCALFVKRKARQRGDSMEFSGPDGGNWRRVVWSLDAGKL